MKQLLNSIHQDHRNFARLLTVLKSDIEKLKESANPDFIRLYDIMNYMTHYPDLRHHPLEELIFSRLLQKNPDSAQFVENIANEHRQLATLGTALKEKLNHVLSGAIVSKDTIIQTATNYWQLLSEHINSEEAELLPLVERTFTQEDWLAINEQVDTIGDPLFGDVVQQQFSELYKRIDMVN